MPSNQLSSDQNEQKIVIPSENYEPPIISSFDPGTIPDAQLAGHNWRQRGTELICESCPFTHATYIPPDKQLYGIDDRGLPMIRNVVVS